jgi:hypothetical protein
VARNNNSANSTSKTLTVAEIRKWYTDNKTKIEKYASAKDAIKTLRDVTKSSTRSFSTVNKESLKSYFDNIGGNEKGLRTTARYMYYRSNILFRLINWYADMWDLNCRKVIPPYNLTKDNDDTKMMKSFEDTLNILDRMDLQGNMTELLVNVYREDVVYAIKFLDDTGMFFYVLDPDECVIDTRYSTSDFGFAMDMSKWKTTQRQSIIEYLGSPLKDMYDEYQKTNVKYVHCPDEYATCFKFRTDIWDTVVPPFVSLFLQLASLEDLVDIQAEADALSIYKLIYLPLKVISGSKESDNFEVTPDISMEYFNRMVDGGTIPDNVGAAVIPGDELKYIDFSKTVDSDTSSVEQASNQILQTAGGGAVINSNNITSTAAFNAWLKSETEFAMSTLLPQIKGWTNRMIGYEVSNPSKVDFLPVSVYTRETFAESLLKSCQYSFANRLAYNTCLGISEKDTIAMLHFENEVLKLPEIMKFPLSSSFTQSSTEDGYTSEVGQGAPTKSDDEISESGERSRNA